MSGNVEISGNTRSGSENNLYILAGDMITLTGPLTGTTPVGVTTGKEPDTEPVDFAEAADK